MSIASNKFYCEKESNYLECDDGNIYNGYYWHNMWVPGLPSQQSQMLMNPPLVYGNAVFYGPGGIEANIKYRGLKLTEHYVDAVSLITCGDIGKQVWLKRPSHEWEGPFLVVDCAKRGDLWGIINYRKEVVEVGFQTALRWGMVSYKDRTKTEYSINKWYIGNVEVSKYSPELVRNFKSQSMVQWFNSNVEFAEKKESCTLRYKASRNNLELPMWRINCEWSRMYDQTLDMKQLMLR